MYEYNVKGGKGKGFLHTRKERKKERKDWGMFWSKKEKERTGMYNVCREMEHANTFFLLAGWARGI